MRKMTLAISLVAALALPGLATGHEGEHGHKYPKGPAKSACKDERSADPAAFKAKYANKNGKRAMRRCVRQHVRAAAAACRDERKADRDAFRTKYANENGKRAFRRCVRQHQSDPVA